MSDDYKIYVDGSQPATLNDGAGALTDCPTLQEAVLAWHRLPPEQKYERQSKSSADRSTPHTRSIGFITDQSQRDK